MQKDPLFDLVERYGVSGVINAEPTVDAVPVIRCKDCKHWKNEDEVFIDEWGIPDGNCIYLHEAQSDDFCSWAERKQE